MAGVGTERRLEDVNAANDGKLFLMDWTFGLYDKGSTSVVAEGFGNKFRSILSTRERNVVAILICTRQMLGFLYRLC